MAMTRDQADALSRLLHLLRPEWDRAGVMAALAKAKHRNPFDLSMAALRATANPEVRSPGVIPLDGQHWTERVAPPEPMRPPRRDEECSAHPGSWQGACNACRADQLAGDQTPRRTETSPITSEHVRSLRGIYAATKADLCACGVPVGNCNDHRATRPDDEDGAA